MGLSALELEILTILEALDRGAVPRKVDAETLEAMGLLERRPEGLRISKPGLRELQDLRRRAIDEFA